MCICCLWTKADRREAVQAPSGLYRGRSVGGHQPGDSSLIARVIRSQLMRTLLFSSTWSNVQSLGRGLQYHKGFSILAIEVAGSTSCPSRSCEYHWSSMAASSEWVGGHKCIHVRCRVHFPRFCSRNRTFFLTIAKSVHYESIRPRLQPTDWIILEHAERSMGSRSRECLVVPRHGHRDETDSNGPRFCCISCQWSTLDGALNNTNLFWPL